MPHNVSRLLVLLVIGHLCGCASSGSQPTGQGDGAPAGPGPANDLFGQYDRTGLSILQGLESRAPVRPNDLPTSGSASYSGVLGFVFAPSETPERIAGNLELSVGFSGNEAQGTVTQMQSDTGVNYSGQLTIQNGQIDRDVDVRTDFSVTAIINGTISDDADWSGSMSGIIAGDFYSNGDVLLGVVEGRIIGELSTLAIGEGVFVAQSD